MLIKEEMSLDLRDVSFLDSAMQCDFINIGGALSDFLVQKVSGVDQHALARQDILDDGTLSRKIVELPIEGPHWSSHPTEPSI
jgi:hypothetical protein